MIKVLGLILARGGSRRLPHKNIINFNGKPLIYWSIDAAIKSDMIDTVYVSSDSQEILDISAASGAKTFHRPSLYAQASTSSESSIYNFLASNPEVTSIYTHICLLQPTSPLRLSTDIDKACSLLDEPGVNSVISVCTPPYVYDKYLLSDPHSGISTLDQKKPPSADLVYPNGAIYLFNIRMFLKVHCLIQSVCKPYVMNLESSLDIDTVRDLEYGEYILAARDH